MTTLLARGREYLRNAVADDAVANDCNRLKPSGIHVSPMILFSLSATRYVPLSGIHGS